jgi:hypothetical protein
MLPRQSLLDIQVQQRSLYSKITPVPSDIVASSQTFKICHFEDNAICFSEAMRVSTLEQYRL